MQSTGVELFLVPKHLELLLSYVPAYQSKAMGVGRGGRCQRGEGEGKLTRKNAFLQNCFEMYCISKNLEIYCYLGCREILIFNLTIARCQRAKNGLNT